MPLIHTRIGDLYQPVNETFTFLEIIHYNGQLCFQSFKQQPPFWSIDTYKPDNLKYIGNGINDPTLRRRCECLSEVNFWLMYRQLPSIPRTSEYYAAIREWQRIATTAQELLILKAYEKQKRWLTCQNPMDWTC